MARPSTALVAILLLACAAPSRIDGKTVAFELRKVP
jgi:hypothetical protein